MFFVIACAAGVGMPVTVTACLQHLQPLLDLRYGNSILAATDNNNNKFINPDNCNPRVEMLSSSTSKHQITVDIA